MNEEERMKKNTELFQDELERFFWTFASESVIDETMMVDMMMQFCHEVNKELEENHERIEAQMVENGELEPW